MSKGGAGKVYFVLYLAVVLELLIIIVERDEAEEHLHAKQKETMKIVESILSQLQAGAGSEGMNTRPQDEITLPPPGINLKEAFSIDLKANRRYIVEVGVTDVSTAAKKREGENDKEYIERVEKLVKLANVEELEYAIFFNSSQDPFSAPVFPTDEYLNDNNIDFTKLTPGQSVTTPDGVSWEFSGLQKIVMNSEETFKRLNMKSLETDPFNPVYDPAKKLLIGNDFRPPQTQPDSAFFYSIAETYKSEGINPNSDKKGGIDKRVFEVNFQPPSRPGWYKLRFSSRTNKILGVRGQIGTNVEVNDEASVNIGTVQLKVKDLKNVEKTLALKLEKYKVPSQELLVTKGAKEFDKLIEAAKMEASKESEAVELIGNIRLYGYILKLLTPGQSSTFDQNKGSLEFNIRVVAPKPNISDPVVTIDEDIHRFDKNALGFRFTISPYKKGARPTITLTDEGGTNINVTNIKIATENPAENGPADIIAVTDGPVKSGGDAPRKYTVTVKYDAGMSGKGKPGISNLLVFPAKGEFSVKPRPYYGSIFSFAFEPSSGGKIPSNQFTYELQADGGNQQGSKSANRLALDKSEQFKLPDDAKNIAMRIFWKDPVTGDRTLMFEENKAIELQEPAIDATSMNPSPPEKVANGEYSIKVSGIKVLPPSGMSATDVDMNVEVKITSTLKTERENVNVSPKQLKPKLDANGNITLNLKVLGNLRRRDQVKGFIKLEVTAGATHLRNGKSKSTTQEIQIPVSFTVN